MSDPQRYGLGRVVEHDPASLDFAVPALPYSAMKSVRWKRHIGILDQGQLGSCTGNAGTGLLGTDPFWSGKALLLGLNESYAVKLYGDATRADGYPGEYPPDDSGSSGLAVAKVLKARGLCRIYHHAFGLRSVISALQHGPVLLGIPWYESMFNPDKNGYVTISGGVAGGHELCIEGVGIAAQEVLIANSWGTGWGDHGYLTLKFDQLQRLLGEQGDVTAPRL